MSVQSERRGAGQETAPTADDVVLSARAVSVDYVGAVSTHAVQSVSLDLHRGEVLGIAGESGCGKSTLAFALCQLTQPPAEVVGGSIFFKSRDGSAEVDLRRLHGEALRRFRWNKIAMVFQSAMNALNPVTKLQTQFDDIFRAHAPEMTADERRQRAGQLLDMVAIDPRRLSSFPHELSGGMRQRIMIAMALALSPEVVVMDEPTTALDVVVQREILDEVERLREDMGFSIILITHDLSLLLQTSDRVAVMYAGQIVECAASEVLQAAPAHPYTEGLLASFPDLQGARRELRGIPGSPPDLSRPLIGCSFRPRCTYAMDVCAAASPKLLAPRPGARRAGRGPAAAHPPAWASEHVAACHLCQEGVVDDDS